ncbi:MAG TPA: T9SS type A sorting domain-containing protein, partial [Flavobacteriales bacterium]|nr:T9SS type A sorting domain-containing protein [Flavobacteriales bacterium]
VAMTDIGDNDHSAAIPAQPAGTTVYYYVQGIAVSGKTQVRPIVAPDGWWSFRVLDANTAVVEAQGPAIADLFPNPCTSHVSLKLENSAGALVSILDVTGRTVLSYKGTRVPNEGRLLLDVSMLPTGTYALTVASSKGTATRKLMKH